LTKQHLKSAWFQPLTYAVKTWFQSLPFKCNLYRYGEGVALLRKELVPGGVNAFFT
jgi:hypothetical protein